MMIYKGKLLSESVEACFPLGGFHYLIILTVVQE